MSSQEAARPRVFFGHGHIRALGLPTTCVVGLHSPLAVEAAKYRSSVSRVGKKWGT